MPTERPRSARGLFGSIQPFSKAMSPSQRSTEPMVTDSQPDCSRVHAPSHNRSCGQMRPQISGRVEVADACRHASSARPSARSEEHTSELQVTNAHLVCRLLLAKKNTQTNKQ